jgi:mono/diheme cytochrome c family protein
MVFSSAKTKRTQIPSHEELLSMMPQWKSASALLIALSPALSATAHAQAGGASKAAVRAGQQIYYQRCLQCHSVNKDQVMIGPSLWGEMTTSPHRKTAAQVRAQIHDGKGKMPAFKDILTKEDTDNLLAFIKTL